LNFIKIFVVAGGQWMLSLIDHYGGSFIIFALTIVQLIGVVYVYGLDNFCWDVEFMTGRIVSPYWRISWAIITPGLMILIFLYSMANLENPTYGALEFPFYFIVIGWVIFIFGIIQLFIWMALVLLQRYNQVKKSSTFRSKMSLVIKNAFESNCEWGPKDPKIKVEWLNFKSEAKEKQSLLIRIENHSRVQQILYSLTGRYRNGRWEMQDTTKL
jgi:solute carrier family 6 amino acid transporter-like protein 5/7/9/14